MNSLQEKYTEKYVLSLYIHFHINIVNTICNAECSILAWFLLTSSNLSGSYCGVNINNNFLTGIIKIRDAEESQREIICYQRHFL